MATPGPRDIRITDLDVERTRRTIHRVQASHDVSEAWHRMAEPMTGPTPAQLRRQAATEDEDDGLDGARGIANGMAITGFVLGVLWVISKVWP